MVQTVNSAPSCVLSMPELLDQIERLQVTFRFSGVNICLFEDNIGMWQSKVHLLKLSASPCFKKGSKVK